MRRLRPYVSLPGISPMRFMADSRFSSSLLATSLFVSSFFASHHRFPLWDGVLLLGCILRLCFGFFGVSLDLRLDHFGGILGVVVQGLCFAGYQRSGLRGYIAMDKD